MLERLRFFTGENLDVDRTFAIIDYLSGQLERRWTMDDFKLAPPERRSRDDWDEEEEEKRASLIPRGSIFTI